MSEKKIAGVSPCIITLQPGKYAWCSCGHSSKQPMCDGSHQGTGFEPHRFEVEEETKMALCLCKHTDHAPKCDGSHSNLPPTP